MDDLVGYNTGQSVDSINYAVAKEQQLSLKFRLDNAVKEAEKKLADAKRAREILDQYPELEELINLLGRGRF